MPELSTSASASRSASVSENRNQDMNVDKLPICTPIVVPTPFHSETAFHTPASIAATPFNGPPSARGGVPMTPFLSLLHGTGGGDTYFPTMPPFQTVTESLKITPIPEDAPMKLALPQPSVQVRTGGFLSPPLLSALLNASPLSVAPKATSPLALSSFPPSHQVRGPPQFNLAVIPPSNTGDQPSDPSVDDYVNASYVQPLGTRKRYIATQGPLPATFVDFWT